MAFAMAPTPQPAAQVKRVVSKLLEEILNAPRYGVQAPPVPLALPIGQNLVPIKDLAPSIARFRNQNAILERANSDWPAVRVYFRERPQLGVRWIPLDLRDGIDPGEPREKLEHGLHSREVQHHLIARAQQGNLDTKFIDRQEATRNFTDVLSDFIPDRARRPVHREDDDPPSDEFTITTDEGKQEILFATGYFISTRQGFGMSTPAARKLQWGPYIFGINKRGEHKFSDTLWTVPDVLSIHLTV